MLKPVQQSLILALCVLFPSMSRGATLSVDDAKNVAADFFQSGENYRLADKDAFVLVHTATDDSRNPVCYVFNAKDGKGFVIVSADSDAMPVIGYSDTSTWSVNVIPEAAGRILSVSTPAGENGSRMLRVSRAGENESKLLNTPSWSQEAPFNNNIPNRRLTGCVGVALAEILKYHTYPASRPASLVKDGESTTYAWTDMRDDNYRSGYSASEAEGVATLVADAAIAIGTDFGMSSSSAFEVKVPYALTSMFGYDSGVSYKKRAEMDKDSWEAVIVNEINEGRPVLYSGQDVSSGHAFVCDGYEMRGSVPFFHINWGWGGSANGYYASDALNPVVSKAHSYNDLTTIVYNIKPAANSIEWSPIHVTSDERQVGLVLDVDDISSAASFTARVGSLKNISNTDFSGKLSIALFDANGKQKCLLNDGRNFSLVALQTNKYVDFTCKLPAGTSVANGDVVRLVTMANGASAWLPVAGDLLAPGEAAAKGGAIPYLSVTLPGSTEDAEVTAADNRVIKGRDYTFKVVPKSADKVVSVKANGFLLTADASNNYKLTNVLEDQTIDILVQNAADVLSKSTLWVDAGNLQNLLTDQEAATVTDLTLFGTINVNDFNFIRDRMKVNRLDLSQVTIVANGSNPANAIPTKAFNGYRSLKQIILPKNLTTFKNGCLAQTGLTSIEIPASVGTWEYNVFVGCNALREVIVRRSSPAWINWCVFNGTPQTKLVVPVGATAAYMSKEYWQDFKEVVEENAVAPDHYTVSVQEKKALKFTSVTEGTEFAPGSDYSFMVESDDSLGDANMEVYANSQRLYADANGTYTAKINANTLIHVEFKQPVATTVDNTWKLTGDAGGIGLVTEVVNVPVGRSFVVRANAIKVPKGNDAAKFYGIVLTDKDGGIKEFISSIVSNYYSNDAANLTYNFYCQVKESQVKEGNQIRLATSYNKKTWQLVEAEADSITDRLAAISNPVVYHNVVMPESVTGARIEGGATQVVRGMPFSLKATAINPAQRVTVAINGENKATKVPIANISIPAVLEDLDVTIMVTDADAGDYMVFNIQEGQLASKLADCPERVKLIGTMLVSEFDVLRAKAGTIIDLDMADVTVKGAAMTGNSIPENAFAPTSSSTLSALKTVILPNGLERINKNAFARCTQITELTIPANVSYIGDGAFSSCVALRKIIAKPKAAPTCGNLNPFPSGAGNITLEVPKGSEESYSVGSTWWSLLSLYKAPTEAKDYYWIKIDESRAKSLDCSGNALNSIGVGAADMEIVFELPNVQRSSYKEEYKTHMRPGVPFKIYDNGIDVFANLGAYQYNVGSQYYYPYQHWSMTAGKLGIRYNHSATSGPTMLQNHEINVYFYYALNFENKAGAEGVTAEIVEMPEGCEWRNVPMTYFELSNRNTIPVLYREGSEFKIRLTDTNPGTEYAVNLMTKVMTKTGPKPEYEEREMTLEGNNGIYTIPALEGDTWIRISGTHSYEEGEPIPADAISNLNKEAVLNFAELTPTGNMSEAAFEAIREKFDALESLDLTEIENSTLPANAFEGMDQLKDVIVSDNVTEIGAGCFKDCENIESLTLPGVTEIGEGAFEGCSNLTSILLPSVGNAVSRAAESGVTAASFKGLNPNCIIYIGSTEIADAESLNLILNQNGQRVAASDIVLDGNYPFSAPASFSLGNHRISFTIDIPGSDSIDVDGGWKGIMLPFEPTRMEYGVEFGKREGSGLNLLSFDDENSETMTPQTTLVANRPYMANVCAPFKSVPVTFYGEGKSTADSLVYDIAFTPVAEETVAVGKDFSLYGTFDGVTRTTVVCYALNEKGSSFISATESETATPPFGAYLCANDGVVKGEMAVGTHPLWIHDPVSGGVSGTKLYRGNKIEIVSATPGASIYYTVDGSDPSAANPDRILYKEPIAMEGEALSVKAIAEYKGNISDSVVLDYELKKVDIDYALSQNWNWISHNMETSVAVADFAATGISSILSQTQEVVRDPKLGLVGTLTELAPAVGYKVCVDKASWSGKVAGFAFDPTTPVKLHRGWNWIGCPVDDASLLITDLLSGLEVEAGDMLVGLDGFEQVNEEGAWVGTLTSLVPGTGYMYYSNSDKEFVYNLAPVAENAQAAKAPRMENNTPWVIDNHRYASVMPVTACLVDVDGFEADARTYQVGAFCGDECRGIGVYVDGAVMINVHGNPGDRISFRFITPDNEEMLSSSAISFNEMPVSTLSEPYRITLDRTSAISSVYDDAYVVEFENGTLSLKGDLSTVVAVEVYDIAGHKIGMVTNPTDSSVNVGNFEPGVVIVLIRTENTTIYRKVLVK
ncbi:MAG: C10 family peptidase [Duncaniella sp.]|nr:C10 family peptidase [Duncaniella sp.]